MDRKKIQKKKDRERESRKKVLKRRERMRSQVSEKYKMDLMERDTRTRKPPIVKEEYEKAVKLKAEEIKLQLHHNMQILQALNDEYEAELAKKQEMLTQLEAQQGLSPE
jgi:hypothetical protein